MKADCTCSACNEYLHVVYVGQSYISEPGSILHRGGTHGKEVVPVSVRLPRRRSWNPHWHDKARIRLRVIHHGIEPAMTHGAITKKTAEPRTAVARRTEVA